MNVGSRLKSIRNELNLSQEALGAQGFVSTPGWIKFENGQRIPSDRMLHRFVSWLMRDNYYNSTAAASLLEELLTIKYLGDRSAFIRKLAYYYAKSILARSVVLVSEDMETYKPAPRRNRSKGSKI